MKKIAIAAIASGALALGGCSATKVSTNSMPLTSPLQTNVEADVEVGGKISGEATFSRFLVFPIGADDSTLAEGVSYGGGVTSGYGYFGQEVQKAKAAAAYEAVESSGADIIVAPKYEIDRSNYLIFSTTQVKVSGYKGTINSIE
ncbi:hypothetical protein [Salicola sp. Rm-C-2C1-2]|uniref:hypothetical protein n=1 Tax=Salicola sp. Rm-C-2C1-2 TaxID=3141321 RepID=UPI0032E4D441